MRKLGLLSACAVTLAMIAGCGGGGGSSSKVTRTVAGFVYVLGNAGSANPDAVIIPSAVAPSGFFAPTAGTVTLSVPEGTITRAPDQEVFNMATSNAIICSVRAKENTLITATGSGLQFEGNPRSFSSFSTSIGVRSDSGTVLPLNNGGSTYNPGPPASLLYTIDGAIPTDPTVDFISGAPGYVLAIVALDASGVITNATFNVASSNAGVVVDPVPAQPAAGPFTLIPGGLADPEGPVDITIDTVGANLQATINGNFDHGTATTITLMSSGPSVTWGTLAPAEPNTTVTLTATVMNQFGLGLPGENVTFDNPKAPGNTWAASPGTWLTAISNGGVSDVNGVVTATFNPPTEVDAPIPGNAAKGVSSVTASTGSLTSSPTTDVTVLRPIGALTATGPARMDVGTSSPISGAGSFTVTGASDVDGDSATIPAGSITWNLTNTAGVGTVGNPGDTSPQSTGNANNVGNVVSAGSTAGQFTMVASIGAVNSNTITTEVYASPSKVVFNPATVVSVIVGAAGEYVVGPSGTPLNFSFSLLDAYGHDVTAESSVTSTSFIDSLTGGSITSGGANVTAFTITSGPGDGLFRITANGTWNGAAGGGPVGYNLQRQAGHNAP
jgi:hypothetical protein